MRPRCLPILVVLGASVACNAQPPDPILLSLDNQTVRRSEFERHIKAVEVRGGAAVTPDVRRALLDSFLEERVLVLAARAKGLLRQGGTPEDEAGAVQQLLAEDVLSKIEVPEEEIAGYYRDHTAEFRTPEAATVRQILVSTESQAKDIRRRLLRGPKDFDVTARALSRSPEAGAGGLMGTFHRGELPAELETVAFALPAGGTSEVIATSFGFHILRVDARQPARDQSLAECHSHIEALLSREKADRVVRQFVRSLMARAKVDHEAAEIPFRDS